MNARGALDTDGSWERVSAGVDGWETHLSAARDEHLLGFRVPRERGVDEGVANAAGRAGSVQQELGLGLDDVALGARQVKNAAYRKASKVKSSVKSTAVNTYNAAAEQMSTAADTISEGYGAAKARTKAAVGKLAGFFGW